MRCVFIGWSSRFVFLPSFARTHTHTHAYALPSMFTSLLSLSLSLSSHRTSSTTPMVTPTFPSLLFALSRRCKGFREGTIYFSNIFSECAEHCGFARMQEARVRRGAGLLLVVLAGEAAEPALLLPCPKEKSEHHDRSCRRRRDEASSFDEYFARFVLRLTRGDRFLRSLLPD